MKSKLARAIGEYFWGAEMMEEFVYDKDFWAKRRRKDYTNQTTQKAVYLLMRRVIPNTVTLGSLVGAVYYEEPKIALGIILGESIRGAMTLIYKMEKVNMALRREIKIESESARELGKKLQIEENKNDI